MPNERSNLVFDFVALVAEDAESNLFIELERLALSLVHLNQRLCQFDN